MGSVIFLNLPPLPSELLKDVIPNQTSLLNSLISNTLLSPDTLLIIGNYFDQLGTEPVYCVKAVSINELEVNVLDTLGELVAIRDGRWPDFVLGEMAPLGHAIVQL